MSDDLDLFFSASREIPSQNIMEFTKHIIKWKNRGEAMMPEDVLNYMIQESIITEYEVLCVMIELYSSSNSLDIQFPKKYNI